MKKDKWIENLLVAQAMMIDIPNALIYPVLDIFCRDPADCGSAACFGGWVARHPHFKAQGVFKIHDGAPRTNSLNWASDVSYMLFGAEELFFRNLSKRSDRDEINHRIKTQLEALL